jgi:hypothetical protein
VSGSETSKEKKASATHDLYGGISDVEVPSSRFDFGSGITLTPTKAHFMMPSLMSFERPEDSFPAWQSASGSIGFDIVAEILVPAEFNPPNWFDQPNTVWWFAALLRLRGAPHIRVPVVSNMSFSQAARTKGAAFWPVESESARTRFVLEPDVQNTIGAEALEWVKRHWFKGGCLMNKSREFNLAFQAFDQSSFARDPGLALLLLWSALEGLFSPARSELRFRVSAYIATFLEPPGSNRLALQSDVAKLYDARSAAAHGRSENAERPLTESYALLKRVLLRLIENDHVPTIDEINAELFGAR